MPRINRSRRHVAILAALTATTLVGCSGHETAAQCDDGSDGTLLATIGGSSGDPDKTPVVDANNHTVKLLVIYTRRQSGLVPVSGTKVAVIPAGAEPILNDGELANGNKRTESVRRTPRAIRLSGGRYFLATGLSDGPVEVRQCP